MAYQSPSSFFFECTYDVFLSFRGTDTRYGFTGNLHKALTDKEIRTFIDDKELEGGKEITPSLVKAIEDSRIFILVFSTNYASSSFCMDELVHIIHCSKEKNRLILPVFYGVDPTHVRHQTGSYGKAITKHKKKFTKNMDQDYTRPIHIFLIVFLLAFLLHSHGSTITFLFILILLLLLFLLQNNKEDYTDNTKRFLNWKIALTQAANLSGHHFNPRNEYEHQFIEKIVKVVVDKISRARLHVANYPVGLESRVLQVKSRLDMGGCDDGVHMVGIYGTGGMGKSSLARATFNLIADQFECLCFLYNVRENSAQNGLKCLQEEILSRTVGLDIKLRDVSEGIPIIKKTLHRKKVLLILDDVDKLEQLWALAGEHNWFGQGSRVIITTRDKHLLSCHMIERTYEVDGLNEEEAFELLRWMAFKTERVDLSYEHVLNRAVTYASGLPLALEVVGSNLFGKSIEEWKDLLDGYEKIPNKDIQGILRVSFDGLKEIEQSVFLDIACCFKGYELKKVQDILLAHYGCSKKHEIGVLVQKSLMKISLFRTVTLHDLIADMGKEIVRLESPKRPGKRSRLWFYEDIVHVLEQNTGTNRIEILYLNFPSFEEEIVEWEGDELKKMINLKTLIIKNGCFSRGVKNLPNSLRVLDWCKYPSPYIPSNFCAKKLSICKLREGCLTSFVLPSTQFLNMRELNVESCQFLTSICDVSGLPNLEKFIFQNCENLVTIHASVGFLNKLKVLNADGCRQLRTFPPIKLTSLQVLRLQHCKNLREFPEILGVMENIEGMVLEGTSIEELSFSFQNLTGLHTVRIRGSGILSLPSSILMLPNLSWIMVEDCILWPIYNDKLSLKVSSNLQTLILQNCNISDAFLSTIIMWFANLEYLDLSRNNFTILPKCIEDCRFLSSIVLDGCMSLKEIRGIPPNLKTLSALQCQSLTSSTRSMLLNKQSYEARRTNFCIPGGSERIPEWFEHKSTGLTMSFWVPREVSNIIIFFSTKLVHNNGPISEDLDLGFDLFINGIFFNWIQRLCINCTHVFHLNLNCVSHIQNSISIEQQIHVELKFESCLTWRHRSDEVMKSVDAEMGVHVVREKSMSNLRNLDSKTDDCVKSFEGFHEMLSLWRKKSSDENNGAKMERPIEYIGDITDKKDFWKLAVKVKDKWTVVKDGKKHIEMVIVDAKGNDIQVIIPTAYKAVYDWVLQENFSYTLSNFQVLNNDLAFKASDHRYKLRWTGGTTAVDVNVHDILNTETKFKSFAEIISGKWRADLLIHVIGVVQDMGYCQITEGTGKKQQVNFTIKDLSDISINCTLWEEYAAKFIQYNNGPRDGGPVIVMLKYCKVKEEGRFPLSVSNTYSFTKLFINDNIPEINLFRESLPKDDQLLSQSQLVCTQSHSSSHFMSEEDLLANSLILPLSHIIQLDQISYCVTVAKVDKINSTKNGWYYFACHKCPKIAKGDKPPYTCEDGHNTETEIVRYKLEIEVSHEEEKSTFVLWDREVTQLLGITAAQLRMNMIQAGITNRFEYPLLVDNIADKTLVFKVKWQPRWKTCSVVCYKEGTAFIDQVRSKFPNYQLPAPANVPLEPATLIEDALADNAVEDEYITISAQDVSATAEYDPESLSQMTPLSNFKSPQVAKNWDTLSQLTPTSNITLPEMEDQHTLHDTPPSKAKQANSISQPRTHDAITPAKHSSSKRFKLIKKEKK